MSDDVNIDESDNLDRLLHDYFSAELDSQAGRAGAGFRLHLLQARAAAPRRRRRHMTFGWAVGIVGTALAASVAVLTAAPALWRSSGASTPGRDPGVVAEPAPVTYTQVVGQTIDEGTYLVDGRVPVRKLRRERVEQAMWYDAEMGAHVQVSVPREDVMFVEMATY